MFIRFLSPEKLFLMIQVVFIGYFSTVTICQMTHITDYKHIRLVLFELKIRFLFYSSIKSSFFKMSFQREKSTRHIFCICTPTRRTLKYRCRTFLFKDKYIYCIYKVWKKNIVSPFYILYNRSNQTITCELISEAITR